MKRVVLQDATNGQAVALEGELSELLPRDNTVYVDRQGNTFDPRKDVTLEQLPQDGVIQLPRTTWYADEQPFITDTPSSRERKPLRLPRTPTCDIKERPEDQLARAAIYAVMIAVAYNIIVLAASASRPLLQQVVTLFSHGHGFTMGMSAACVMSDALLVLAGIVGLIVLFSWPTDLVHLATALVGGGLLGVLLRRVIKGTPA